jgi:hypothetical protein
MNRYRAMFALNGKPSPHVEPVIALAQAAGWKADIVPVDDAFQRGADRMLRLRPGH